MSGTTEMLRSLHAATGDFWFIAMSIVLSVVLSFVAIPWTTHLMVHAAGGLAGKYLGPRWRTLSINASTNNPEAFSMLVSFGIRKMGGWSNPLGSLLANVYLMYGFGALWVFGKFALQGDREGMRKLLGLLKAEKRLVIWHLIVSVLMFGLGYAALRIMMGDGSPPTIGWAILAVVALLAMGIGIFVLFEYRLKGTRPELFDDMDETHFNESWLLFIAGTAGVVLCCWIMNALFLGWSEIYESSLTRFFGPLVFSWLHYFLGSLITSLPELTVTVHNLEKLRAPDLNTALGSVSYSNMVNLAIALAGLVIWLVLVSLGVSFTW